MGTSLVVTNLGSNALVAVGPYRMISNAKNAVHIIATYDNTARLFCTCWWKSYPHQVKFQPRHRQGSIHPSLRYCTYWLRYVIVIILVEC